MFLVKCCNIESAVTSCFSFVCHHTLDLKTPSSVLILQLCDEEITAIFRKFLWQLIYFPVKNLHDTWKPKVPAIESCLPLPTRMKIPYMDPCKLISALSLIFLLMNYEDQIPWIFWYKPWLLIILVVLLWILSSFQQPAWSMDTKSEHDMTVTPLPSLKVNLLSIFPS